MSRDFVSTTEECSKLRKFFCALDTTLLVVFVAIMNECENSILDVGKP